MNNSIDFAPDRSAFKEQWLPLEQAIQRVAKFEHDFGQAHLSLACHAAFASILTPELVNLIRINFLDTSVEWIAESDLLLSPLCTPIQQGSFEIEPQIRQILLIILQNDPAYGLERLREIASFLYTYTHESPLANKLPIHIKHTYQWISGAYLDPDATVQNMFDFLSDSEKEGLNAKIVDYLQVGKAMAMIANPLEMTSLQVELEDIIESTHYSALYWYGDREKLTAILPRPLNDMYEATDTLTNSLVNQLADSGLAASIDQKTPGLKDTTPIDAKPVTIFCSYTRKDKELLNALEAHLRPLQDMGLLTYWHDSMISAGSDWEKEIHTYLNTAQIILLLISPDFLASDYCYSKEMQRALERHWAREAFVLPILLRPVDWHGTPFESLQFLPTNTKPITTWNNLDEALFNVTEGIRQAIEDLPRLLTLPKTPSPQNRQANVQPIELFCAYAHEDEVLLNTISIYLGSLKRQGFFSVWHDRLLTPDTDWSHTIDTHVNSASVILMLISADFLASDYAYGIEAQRALERHQTREALVLPILLRPVDWRGTPFEDLQILPANTQPITTWDNLDEAFFNVAEGIRQIIGDLPRFLALSKTPSPRNRQANVQPIELFYAYAHEDEALRYGMEKHLSVLKRQGFINEWYVRLLAPDTDWSHVIDAHVNSVSVILLFISVDFLASGYAYGIEAQQALERHRDGEAQVIPILLRPVDLHGTPFEALQFLPDNAQPITTWNNQDAAFADIATRLRQAIENSPRFLIRPKTPTPQKRQTNVQPIEIFYAYAHEDEVMSHELMKHLNILQRQGLISSWHNRSVRPGTNWTQTTDTHINTASVILILISSDFIASDYCYGVEMHRAMQRNQAGEAIVIPILLRPVDWHGTPFEGLQHLPNNTQPIASWSNQDAAFTNVIVELRRAIENRKTRDIHATIKKTPKLLFIRNSESEAKLGKASSHAEAVALTAHGKKIAQEIADKLPYAPDRIIASPYLRAWETATPTMNRFPEVSHAIWQEVREFTYLGSLAGQALTKQERSKKVQAYWELNDPTHRDGDGETFAEFIDRTREALKRLRQMDSFIVIFTHEQFMRAVQLFASNEDETEDLRHIMREFRETLLNNPLPYGGIIEMPDMSFTDKEFNEPTTMGPHDSTETLISEFRDV